MSQTTTATTTAQAETTAPAPTPGTAPAAAGHTEGSAAESGQGGGVFPPLDTSTFPSQLFWLVIFFALLYLLMSRIALPRLERIINNRMGRINNDLAKAQALKTETETAIASYEKALADARAKAQSIAAETKAKMTAEMDAERGTVEAALSKKVAAAEATIATARAKAMEEISTVAADTAAEIVAELTGTTVSKDAVAKAVAGMKG